MMRFDFQCRVCEVVNTVKGTVGHVPRTPTHCSRRMRRLYTAPKFHVSWGRDDYIQMAYEGSEKVPGLTTAEVREALDTMTPVRS